MRPCDNELNSPISVVAHDQNPVIPYFAEYKRNVFAHCDDWITMPTSNKRAAQINRIFHLISKMRFLPMGVLVN